MRTNLRVENSREPSHSGATPKILCDLSQGVRPGSPGMQQGEKISWNMPESTLSLFMSLLGHTS